MSVMTSATARSFRLVSCKPIYLNAVGKRVRVDKRAQLRCRVQGRWVREDFFVVPHAPYAAIASRSLSFAAGIKFSPEVVEHRSSPLLVEVGDTPLDELYWDRLGSGQSNVVATVDEKTVKLAVGSIQSGWVKDEFAFLLEKVRRSQPSSFADVGENPGFRVSD